MAIGSRYRSKQIPKRRHAVSIGAKYTSDQIPKEGMLWQLNHSIDPRKSQKRWHAVAIGSQYSPYLKTSAFDLIVKLLFLTMNKVFAEFFDPTHILYIIQVILPRVHLTDACWRKQINTKDR